MKNLRKGFTLVEMLIVVVIIGILAAALLPRLTGAQAATRDVARQKGLSDLASALEMVFTVDGAYPAATANGSASGLVQRLVTEKAYLKSIPSDPQAKSAAIKVGSLNGETGQYAYVPLKKNSTENGAFALVAKVETIDKANASKSDVEAIDSSKEFSDIENLLCKKVKLGDSVQTSNRNDCSLQKDELYYVHLQ